MAGEIVKPLAKAATGDLVTLRGRVFRQVQDPDHPKMHFLEPIEVEAHVNPASILGGLAGTALGILAATVAWHGVSIPTSLGGSVTLFKGLKETALGAYLNAAYERFQYRRAVRASNQSAQAIIDKLISGEIGEFTDPDWFDPDPCVRSHAAWKAETQPAFRVALKARAKEEGCEWAQ